MNPKSKNSPLKTSDDLRRSVIRSRHVDGVPVSKQRPSKADTPKIQFSASTIKREERKESDIALMSSFDKLLQGASTEMFGDEGGDDPHQPEPAPPSVLPINRIRAVDLVKTSSESLTEPVAPIQDEFDGSLLAGDDPPAGPEQMIANEKGDQQEDAVQLLRSSEWEIDPNLKGFADFLAKVSCAPRRHKILSFLFI